MYIYIYIYIYLKRTCLLLFPVLQRREILKSCFHTKIRVIPKDLLRMNSIGVLMWILYFYLIKEEIYSSDKLFRRMVQHTDR